MTIGSVNNNYIYKGSSGAVSKTDENNSDIFDQIMENAQNTLSEDVSEIVIKLKPSTLGKLSIKISAEGGITVARFETDNEVVKEVLNENIEKLKSMLKEKGFSVHKIMIKLNSEEGESNSQIVEQIVNNIENSLSENTPEIIIKMKPESLGNLSIRVYKEDGIEIAEFLADSNIVKNVIHAEFDKVKEALKDKDFNVQRYIVSVKEDETPSNDKNDLISKADPNSMDKNMFLKLLITQLSNQDPLNPIEDREFIAQMAQFSSLEQMQQMNKNIQLNNIILDQINESFKEQSKRVNESLYYINDNITSSFEKLNNNIEKLKDDQDESLDNDLEVINELININKAIGGYDMDSNK
ncbi:flagellar hook-length control protein FliK [Paramaledivibacter caminithermalis]|uniref:Basal-body rod modification protein FlgD n=1 Tax=Paramaledivibacter caminithermalis (strain DSM 15212 / CIP 107654 / DViRD3) TaxID=1121301 RepID=A0A1M6N7F7_PARC5|nr:flagellar hook-length control protein FliK [Paramaledivibacter caminithermalis]SHJ91695.1 hook-length control protein FliK [Paramaledivibacter caminithermalis DSM 15212]